ncbi:MAG: hypothetical protein MRQ13_02130 [Candidatus Midichloria sp.]|nr:hypothetical protein [Candidatus Midichloria sp.]
MLRLIIFLAFFLQVMPSKATTVPRGIGNENRIKIINYKPNTVFRFVGHYTYQSIIEFGLDEEIDNLYGHTDSLADCPCWQPNIFKAKMMQQLI